MIATLVSFPIPAGITAVPLTIWSPFLGFTLILTHKSTVYSNEDTEWSLTRWIACQTLYSSCLKCFSGLGASTMDLNGLFDGALDGAMVVASVSVEKRNLERKERVSFVNIEIIL